MIKYKTDPETKKDDPVVIPITDIVRYPNQVLKLLNQTKGPVYLSRRSQVVAKLTLPTSTLIEKGGE